MQSPEENKNNPEEDVAKPMKSFERKSSIGSNVISNASFAIRQASQKLKRAASTVGSNSFDHTKQVAVFVLKKLKFIGKSDACAAWADVEKRFQKLTSKTSNGLLCRSDFGECIGMRRESKEFACKLFDALSRSRNITGGFITKSQLKEFWDQIVDQSVQSRLKTFFDLIDANADGSITEDEIKESIILSGSVNKLSNFEEHAGEYAKLIMEALDDANLGYVTRQSLEALVESAKDCDEDQNVAKTPSHSRLNPSPTLIRLFRETEYFLVDNWQRIWVMALWIGAMSGLFAYKYVQYRNRDAFKVMGHCVCVAKGSAETLKLNMALILLPVCRNTITWLRNKTGLGVVVPFDDNLNFHQLIGLAVAIGTAVHAISHLACDYPRILRASPEKFEPLAPYFKEKPTSYWQFLKDWENITGFGMVFVMIVAFTLASAWFRRYVVADHHRLPQTSSLSSSKKKNDRCWVINKLLEKLRGFNVFWYTHHLFIFVYALLMIHGIKLYLTKKWYNKTTWMYISVSIVLYAIERLIRLLRSNIEAVKIIKADGTHKEVLTLRMSKPHGFNYKSGQYIFIKCPIISPFEWHPFSITSAPEDDFISVHIRSVGDWTRKIKAIFSDACKQQQANANGDTKDGLFEDGENNPNYPKILIDGPYGAPTQEYKKYEVVLLIGLGIGATPMISVLKEIVHNIKTLEEENDKSLHLLEQGRNHCFGENTTRDEFKTTRAYFYWVAKEQSFFDWFKGVMDQVAETQHKGVIEMHNYCASVHEEGDIRSVLITMIQSINHYKSGVDIVSGTKVKSYFGKPDWRLVYKDIAKKHPESRVGVFYCGLPQAAKQLRNLAHEISRKTTTKFEFHKENF